MKINITPSMACEEKKETDLDMCLATPNGDRRNSIPLPRIIFTRPAVSPCEDSQMSPSEPVNYVTVDTTKFLGTAISPNAVLVWCPRVVEMTSSEFPHFSFSRSEGDFYNTKVSPGDARHLVVDGALPALRPAALRWHQRAGRKYVSTLCRSWRVASMQSVCRKNAAIRPQPPGRVAAQTLPNSSWSGARICTRGCRPSRGVVHDISDTARFEPCFHDVIWC